MFDILSSIGLNLIRFVNIQVFFSVVVAILLLPQVISFAFPKRPSIVTMNKAKSFNESTLQRLKQNVYFDRDRIKSAKDIQGISIESKEIKSSKKHIRTYCLSDLHAETQMNLDWVNQYCKRKPEDADFFTIFVLPGDIGSDLERIRAVLTIIAANYDAVSYIPGNHEAWMRSSSILAARNGEDTSKEDSITKLIEVLNCAKSLGVHVGPLRVSSTDPSSTSPVVIMPLYSWYHGSWDTEPSITNPLYLEAEKILPFQRKWSDFSMCRWPKSLLSQDEFVKNENTILAEAFAKLNEPFLHPAPVRGGSNTVSVEDATTTGADCAAKISTGSPLVKSGDTVISHSHFLPRTELCIEKRFLMEPGLSSVIGSDPLECQVRRLQPCLHLFGHTHIPMDLELEGVRYIQWPLGYRRESAVQCAPIFSSGPLLVHDTSLGSDSKGIPEDIASKDANWSKYYRENARMPSKVNELAPWLTSRLQAITGTSQ